MQESILGGAPRFQRLNTLLTYVPDYGLVICKRCEFAIQPRALSSHLLRHHIYRSERRQLLERISRLKLLNPAEVNTPPAGISALPYLQVSEGYRCSYPTCAHLCISAKRMSLHLHECHKEIHAIDVEIHAQRVHIQTFFRGNKVRYFEVDALPRVSSNEGPTDSTTYPLLRLSHLSQAQLSQTSTATELPMNHLMYLHHYITRTSESLTRGNDSILFWADTIPLHALNQPFLMHGILGVAAFHQAVLTSDAQQRSTHQSNGLIHQSAGLVTFRKLIKHPTAETSTALTAFARLLGVQFCAQALLDAEDHPLVVGKSPKLNISQVMDFVLLLRGGCDLLVKMQGSFPEPSGFAIPSEVLQGLGPPQITSDADGAFLPYVVNQLHALLQTKISVLHGDPIRIVDIDDIPHLAKLCGEGSLLRPGQLLTRDWIRSSLPSDTGLNHYIDEIAEALPAALAVARLSFSRDRVRNIPVPRPVIVCYPHIPLGIYSALASLPERLITRGLVADFSELEMFDQSLASLVCSYSRSYAADTTCARWNGIESWACSLSDEFLRHIEAANSLALVLVAHWCVLVSRQERFYWFLNGQSQRMLNAVLGNLDSEMQSFVRDSLSRLSSV
ncbi:Fungal specific transcription factor domain-containing protein [Cladophialophora immunda]|nr:Fungal specific transcription factor domain-containing protein [Cladophialophora immunda]